MKTFLRYSPKFDELTAEEKNLLEEDVQLVEKAVTVSYKLTERRSPRGMPMQRRSVLYVAVLFRWKMLRQISQNF
jgi:hypothetical protein